MDRGFLRRGRADDGEPVQLARLVDAAETRGMYSVEYTVTKQPGPTRHLWSVVALAFNGRCVLITIALMLMRWPRVCLKQHSFCLHPLYDAGQAQ